MSIIDKKQWHERANCRGIDPDLFFPEPNHIEIKPTQRPKRGKPKLKKNGQLTKSEQEYADKVALTKRVCATCTVRPECQAFADSTRQLTGTFAGETSEERMARWRRG